jgi:hypothetical protein
MLRGAHADRWVRFHALPESKRYADSEDEYRIVLARHHALLNALGLSGRCFATALRFTNDLLPPENPGLPEAVYWRRLPDPLDDGVEVVVYASAMTYPSDDVDDLLRAVADEKEVGVIIVPPDAGWLKQKSSTERSAKNSSTCRTTARWAAAEVRRHARVVLRHRSIATRKAPPLRDQRRRGDLAGDFRVEAHAILVGDPL